MSKRIIKFRVWDTRFDRYHSINVELLGSQTGLRETYEPNGLIMKYRTDANINASPEYLDQYDRERFMLEQFTGLLDKNSVEIYEGDIVRYPSNTSSIHKNNPHYNVSVVTYQTDGFGGLRAGFEIGGDYAWDETTEIIGNIHQNSELLHK